MGQIIEVGSIHPLLNIILNHKRINDRRIQLSSESYGSDIDILFFILPLLPPPEKLNSQDPFTLLLCQVIHNHIISSLYPLIAISRYGTYRRCPIMGLIESVP